MVRGLGLGGIVIRFRVSDRSHSLHCTIAT